MDWLTPAVVSTLTIMLILALVYCYLYFEERVTSIGVWALAWSAYSCRFFFSLLILLFGPSGFLVVCQKLSLLATGMLVLWGGHIWSRRQVSPYWFLIGAIGAGWIFISVPMGVHHLLLDLPIFTLVGLIFIRLAIIFLRDTTLSGLGKQVTSWTFILWGINLVFHPLLEDIVWLAPWDYLVGSFCGLLAAIGIILIHFKRVRTQLEQSEKRLKEAQHIAQVGDWTCDPETGLFTWSDEIFVITGMTPRDGDVEFTELLNLIHLEDRQDFKKQVREIMASKGEIIRHEVRISLPDGQINHLEHVGHLRKNFITGKDELVGSVANISARKLAEQKIQRLANYDSLTDLPNRRLLLDRLQQTLDRSSRNGSMGAVLFFDLDHFKNINDSLGHTIGDALLREVAYRLNSRTRAGDTAARLGGDEFIVLLSDLGRDRDVVVSRAQALADDFQNALIHPYRVRGHEFHVTQSIGIAIYPEDGLSADDIITHADTAMYRAKDAGRNTVRFFLPEMQDAAEQRLSMEHDLRKALQRGEFHLLYQPQVDSSKMLVGAEALLRWLHPQRGLIAPGVFIPIAEETGLIKEIGAWVLKTTCEHLCQMPEAPRPIHISVNVSPRQFNQVDFIDHLRKTLRETGADPSRLEFEITEGMLLADLDETVARMESLKEMKVRVAIDDFGTGFSSLSYLKRLPLDVLKIDQSFVREIHLESKNQAIVKTVISMAEFLQFDVIAEGVEKPDEFDCLQKLGCEYYQGYYLGHPLSFEELLKNLR